MVSSRLVSLGRCDERGQLPISARPKTGLCLLSCYHLSSREFSESTRFTALARTPSRRRSGSLSRVLIASSGNGLEASLYQILQILSVTQFEKMPLSSHDSPNESPYDPNQLILLTFNRTAVTTFLQFSGSFGFR